MRKTVFSTLMMPLLLPFLAGFCLALEPVESMRCGSKLVQLGDTKVGILAKCGEPALRENIVRSNSVKKSKSKRGSTVEDRSRVDDQWTYDFGPQDFIHTLTFEGVELKSIGRGGRGTRR
jgi:hypothetical protein